jgi:hypothetical protein
MPGADFRGTAGNAGLGIVTADGFATGSGSTATNLVSAVAAGYKIARGTVTPTSGSHTVVTGLTTVVAVVASLRGAPTITHTIVAGDVGNQSGAPAAGSVLIKSYKPTSTTDTTPIAATTPWSAVDWIAIGT